MANPVSKILIGLVITLALIGFADSTYLLAKRLSGTPIPCFITSGCDAVSKSPHSVLLGIPLAGYGVVFYLAIGILALLYADTKSVIFARLLLLATAFGFISSAYFIYVQKFLIGSFCVYCIVSALISTILFGLGISIYKKLKPKTVS